jgi:AraC family transcriptional regulator, regulatory protein of adaptative response / DNA-3-methyladenine glycosylase II
MGWAGVQNRGVHDFETCYLATVSRDPRFDGRFVVAVTSTGVYCRPVCPSRMPNRENTRFYAVAAAAAEAAGFRACRRCRPDTAPGSPEWNARGDLAGRALRLIADGVADEAGVGGVAKRLAVSDRHLHRLLVAEVGVGPQALAVNRRAQVARMLIESSGRSFADLAFAAGYASIRQFNRGIRLAFGCSPKELRAGATASDDGVLRLRLRYRPPLVAEPLLDWLAARVIPQIEYVAADGYRRTVRLPRSTGWIQLGIEPGHVLLRLSVGDLRDVAPAVRLCRDLFDLDADPLATAEVLGTCPGLRVPGSVDGFETAVRILLGDEAAAIAEAWGEPANTTDPKLTRLFPTPDVLADTEGVPPVVRAVAQRVRDGGLRLDRTADRAATVATLREIGIGEPETREIATHALGDPDAFVDLPDKWRPWRSYAALYLS